MQTSCFAYSVESRSQVEVISVAEDNLGFHLLAQLLKMYAFYRAYRSHGHKDRCLYLSVVGCYYTGASV